MAEELLITQGKQMRAMREEGIVLMFPSGNNYKVRPTSAAQLLKRGNLPNVLVNFCYDVLYVKDSKDADRKYEEFLAPTDRQERVLEVLASYEAVCKEMFIQPRIVDNPQADDEIAIDDLVLADQNWGFWLAFQEVDALKAFRPKQTLDVVGMAEPQAVPSEAVAGA